MSATRRRSPPESTLHGRVGRGTVQGAHGVLQAGVERPGLDVVELLLQLPLLFDERVEVGVGLGEGGGHGVEARHQIDDGLHGFVDHLDDRLGLVQVRLLLQEAHRVALGRGDLALIVLVHSGDDAQQGALARTVQSEDADLGAVEEAQRDVAQHLVLGRVDAPDAHHGIDYLVIGSHQAGFSSATSGG